ncbi:MAG: hypothetical protein GKR91_14815 [Pseudomonadales bacterium]|nr:hypothetical protein [Pseudomonadales bacterium]
MTFFDYNDSPYPIREDIKKEHRDFWQRLAQAGSWWTAAERIAIAQESRNASSCEFCEERKAALSPYTLEGNHHSSTPLSATAIDAVHRIVADQTRITQAWVESLPDNDLSIESYVELAGIVVCVFSIDEFHRSLGFELELLPDPTAGEPSRYRPAQAESGTGFVPMLPKEGLTGPEENLWPGGRSANVLRALSLVPAALRDWLALCSAQYLSVEGMANMVKQDDRSINRMQMELIAARVSAINECFY